MGSSSKLFALTVTTFSIALILVILFAWTGPGLKGVTPETSAALFDEEQVRGIYQRVSPAVVEINGDQRMGGSFVQAGSGSGFLIDTEGHIVTNNHVIEGVNRLRIDFYDGSFAEAEVLGRNPANDIALIKVDREKVAGIQPVELGDSSLVQPGQLAIAIGSPFGMGGSLTAGVISGTDRSLPSNLGRSISGVLQTDALIGPGNSGGPLLDSAGRVVGINTAIQISSTWIGRRSAGFAVPVNTLTGILPQLKAHQEVLPPWLGVGVASVDSLLVETLGLPVDRGVYVTQVTPGGPAAQAGLVSSGSDALGRPGSGGDIIAAVDGAPVSSVEELIARINLHRAGDLITLTVIRDGGEIAAPVTLGEWPGEAAQKITSPGLPENEGSIQARPGTRGFPFTERPSRRSRR